LKQLFEKHTNKDKTIKNENSPTIGELARNDVIYVQYYAHRMNSFRKLLKNSSIMFGEVQDYFFVTKFQSRGLAHDHGLLWVKSPTIQHFFKQAS
jgi:hypothetical protein